MLLLHLEWLTVHGRDNTYQYAVFLYITIKMNLVVLLVVKFEPEKNEFAKISSLDKDQ